MEDNKIALDIDINTSKGGESLASLKREFSSLQKELENTQHGTEEYIELMKKLGKTKDNIGDLRNEINALNPEGKVAALGNLGSKLAGGFEAATGAAALFGAKNEELEKSLLKVQAALALQQGIKEVAGLGDAFKEVNLVLRASPLLWIPVAIAAIGTAMFALKDKVKIVSDAFDWLGEKIGIAVQAGKDFLDWIGVSKFALGDLSDTIDETAKGLDRLSKIQQQNYDREIKLAQAAGKDVTELEIAKQKAMQQTAIMQLDSLKNLEATGKELSEEQKKRKAELVQSIIDTDTEIRVIRLEHHRQELEDWKKLQEDKRVAAEKASAEITRQEEEDRRNRLELEKALHNDNMSILKSFLDSKAFDDEEENQKEVDGHRQAEADKTAETKRAAAERKAERQREVESELSSAAQSVQGLQALTDVFFMWKMKRTQGDAVAQEENRKKQFKANKAFQLVQTAIDGARSVISASAMTPYLYVGLGASIAASIATTAALAKIASTEYQGSPSALTVSPGDAGAAMATATSASPPVINQPNNTVTQVNQDGTVKAKEDSAQRVYVLEGDITEKQKGVSKIEETAKIG